MKNVDYLKLFVWLGLLLFCALFWGAIIKLRLGLYCLVLMIILIVLIIRKLGKFNE
nr:MAG TPA: hypothetical protein [Caudoviricetes sp.]